MSRRSARALPAVLGSRAVRLIGRGLRRAWGALVVGAVALAVVIAAWLVPGLKVNDLHLNEAAVYAVNASQSLVGNLNMQSEELANAAPVGASNYEVLQDQRLVVVRSISPNQLSAYDASTNQMGSPVTLPPNASVVYNNGVLSVANPDNGRVWFGTVDEMLKTDFQQAKAQLEVGEQGAATVTSSGAIIGLDVAKSQLVRPGGVTSSLPFQLEANAEVQLSAVGERAVVLDRTTQRIWVEGSDKPFTVDAGATAQLAPPTAKVDQFLKAQAIYSTRAGLIALTKDGPRSLSGLINQVPVRPVVVGDCVYGAFAGQFIKRCARDSEATSRAIPELPNQASLTFQTNRGSVVLNDSTSGYIWLVNRDMKLIKDWSRFGQKDQSTKESEQTQQVVNPNRKGPNQPPVAKNDLGLKARVGRSTILPILDNDSDPDGDILTVLGPPKVKGATLELIQGGTGLQITLSPQARDTIEFSYTISDGRGKTASARVTVKPIPADQNQSNELPLHFRPTEKLVVNQNQLGTKRALLDWRDPDGDDMVLLDATTDSDDQVTFTADGTISFQDVGKTTGVKKVLLTVSDGNPAGKVTKSELLVETIKGRIVAPVANGDQVSTRVDTEVQVEPIANDVGTNLTLRGVELEGGAKDVTITTNFTDNTFRFKAARPGTYYVAYKVSNGPVTTGLVRIDVAGGASQNQAPVAARDVVLLPPAGTALVDPLLNDTDADSDVLVLQSLSTDPHLSVVMEQRRYLTIKAVRTPTAPVTLTYWVSDGTYTSQGTIVVIPTKLVGSQKPKATRDVVKARAGSIVNVPVLENDASPIGLKLAVDKVIDGPAGRVWIDGDNIRVAVPQNSTGLSFNYQIKDSAGQTDSAPVTVVVVSTDAQNDAPQPNAVEARVLAGTTNRILIPLDGIDNNGDPVTLLGLNTGPRLGRVTKVGDHYLSYEAFPDSQGTDNFRYEVVDSLGAVGVGEVRVGVAPAVGRNGAPVGVDDTVVVRPGRTVTMPLLANDYDPDGDPFGFVSKDPIDLPFATTILNGNAITFTSPTKTGDVPGKYYLRDARSASGSGTITVSVRPGAPNLVPVALDDQVQVTEIIGKDYIEVPVLRNDYDPDGPANQLKLSVPAQEGVEAAVISGKNTLRVKVKPTAQQVRYVVSDPEGGTATAVVNLPGTESVVPLLKDPKTTIQAIAGQRTVIDLNTIVKGTAGRTVRITSVDRVFRTTGKVISSPEKLDWTPDVDYAGPASLVFEVMDKVPAGDKTAKRAVIVVPAVVKPAPNVSPEERKKKQNLEQPPHLRGAEPVLEVGAGEPEERIDLTGFYVDPNGQDFYFEGWKVAEGAGVNWRAGDGRSTIFASAKEDIKAGTTLKLVGTVVDAAGSTAPAQLTIKVVGSTRPRPTTVDDVIDDGSAGTERSVSVLANDKSNLLSNPKLTLVSASVASGDGSARVQGDQVIIRSAPDKAQTMTIVYTVVDATNDPNRQSNGTVRFTVRARPGPPTTPFKVSVGDGTATLKWTDGAANGLPIKGRVLSGSAAGGAAAQTQCATNTCTITGLTNGRDYVFRVTQSNDLGTADSPTSAPMRPDVRPEKMPAPNVKFDNQKLIISWSAGTSRGSPIVGYQVTMADGSKKPVTAATSLVWDGLTNGQPYQFSVQASNKRGDDPNDPTGWSDPSELSSPEHPTGPPPAPTAVTARDSGAPDGKSVTVSWTPPVIPAPANVDKVVYDVFANGKQVSPAAGIAGTSFLYDAAVNGTAYTFTVRGRTRFPTPGPMSAASAVVTPFGRPGQMQINLDARGKDLTMAIVKDGANGKPIDKVFGTVRTNSGSDFTFERPVANGVIGGAPITVPRLGPKYSVLIYASAGGKDSNTGYETFEVRPHIAPLAPLITQKTNASTRGTPVAVFEVDPAHNYYEGSTTYSNGVPMDGSFTTVVSIDGKTQTFTGGASQSFSLEMPAGKPISGTAKSANSEVAGFTVAPPIGFTAGVNQLTATPNNFMGTLRCRASGRAYEDFPGADLMNGGWVGVSNGVTLTAKRAMSAPPGSTPAPTPVAGSFEVSCRADQGPFSVSGNAP